VNKSRHPGVIGGLNALWPQSPIPLLPFYEQVSIGGKNDMGPRWEMAGVLARYARSRAKAMVCILGAVAVLPMSGVSAAIPTRDWSPEEQVTAYGDDNSTWVRPEYLVGSAADGTTVAIWERKRDTDKVFEVSRRPVGGSWSAPVVVAQVSRSSWLGDLVVDASGDATFTMYRVRVAPETYKTFVQTVPANGDIGRRHRSPGTQLVGNGRGDVMAIGSGQIGGPTFIFRPAGGRWSEPAPGPMPSGLALVGSPEVSMDPTGRVQWVADYIATPSSDRRDQIGLTTWNPSIKKWSKLAYVADTGRGLENLFAVGNNEGDLVVGWTEVYDDQEGYVDEAVKSTFIPRGAKTPRPIKTWAHQDDCYQRAQMIGVGIDSDSNATVAWTQCEVDGSPVAIINAAKRVAADGAWGAPELVGEAMRFLEGQFEVNGHGTAMLLYRQVPGFNLVTSRRSPAGDFGAPTVLTLPDVDLSNRTVMDLAATSNATVLYSYYKQHPVYSRSLE
jgi:hypothetical protein